MPKVPIDHSKTQIYKLVHKDDLENENIYVGHTTNWIERKKQHQYKCNYENGSHYNIKVYQYIRQNGGFDEWIMVWLEDYPCGGKPQACARERYWCEHYKSKLNSQIPCRNHKEWKKDNKEHIDKYTEDNKEHIKEYHAGQYQKNKEEHNIKCKTYKEENKEHYKKTHAEYYQKNKDKLKEKVECVKCGSFVAQYNLLEHQKTHKCVNFISHEDELEKTRKKNETKTICVKCGSVVSKSILARHKKSQKCINFVPILDIQNP